jgi:hypothetical protein
MVRSTQGNGIRKVTSNKGGIMHLLETCDTFYDLLSKHNGSKVMTALYDLSIALEPVPVNAMTVYVTCIPMAHGTVRLVLERGATVLALARKMRDLGWFGNIYPSPESIIVDGKLYPPEHWGFVTITERSDIYVNRRWKK